MTAKSSLRRAAHAALCAVMALLSSAAIEAHEIGTTRVSAVFDSRGTYAIEIVTDAAALAQKLAAAGGESFPEGAAPAELQSLFRSHEDSFRRRVRIAFDEDQAAPAIEFAVSPSSAAAASPVANIRLAGTIPAGAGSFTWNYGWTFASYSLTVHSGRAAPSTQWLEGNQASAPFSLTSPASHERFAAWRYLLLGFMHIVPKGLDHMLFVLGIYLLSRRAKTVLYQVSAFTVAHSITLGLSMYGVVALPPRIVEPMIAISIAYVAIENIFLKELKSWRVALVFAFGLLHGMGFAGALKEVGLPRAEFLTALLSFNVGVEAGQLAVIATAFLLVGWHCAGRAWYRRAVVIPVSCMIGCTAVYWTVQRILA